LLSIISKAETQYLDEAKIDALRPPKQDRATAMGMVQLNMPNVWSEKRKGIQSRTGFIILLHPRSLNKCSHY
jgi:hypothetical protein